MKNDVFKEKLYILILISIWTYKEMQKNKYITYCVCMCMYVWREREGEIKREREKKRENAYVLRCSFCMRTCVSIYSQCVNEIKIQFYCCYKWGKSGPFWVAIQVVILHKARFQDNFLGHRNWAQGKSSWLASVRSGVWTPALNR